ncbi:MAG: trigger factor [Clostridia bacterium]|nr:trigger factor [Clostridia bacterium]
MKVNTERIDKKQVEITIEVDEKQVDEGLNYAYKKIVKQVNIPGFRKGKVPRKIIEQRFGVEVFYEEAIDYLMPKAYMEAMEKVAEDFEIVGKPDVDIVQMEQGKPFIFKAKVEVKPEFELGEYKGLELERVDMEVTSEDVEQELKNLQERHAQLEVMGEDDQVEKGDKILLDFVGKDEGVPFEGGSAENYSLEVGSNSFIPGFEEQLVGMKLNEEKVINVTFPEQYHSEELAGKAVTFDVKINEIKRKRLLDLDDEFAKDISEFETLQELKDDIENNLKKQKEEMGKNQLRIQAIEKMVENHEIDVPESMIESQVDTFIREFDYRLNVQGLSLDKYLKYSNLKIEQIREQYKEDAIKAVKKDLILEAIVKAEDIKLSENELDAEIQRLAEAYNQEPEKIKEILERQGQLSAIEHSLKAEKALELVVDHAKIN